jgi:L-lactate dehydrogenase complex protein LldG
MNSREKILLNLKKNQPAPSALPESKFLQIETDLIAAFTSAAVNIGGAVIETASWNEIPTHVSKNFQGKKIVTSIPHLRQKFEVPDLKQSTHDLQHVHYAILPGHFGVAENGAIWITDDQMGDRALPFITEHLALVINAANILPTMHAAYERIGVETYNFGTFIAGPSKTADIEQALVLGAHGAKTLTVFLLSIG